MITTEHTEITERKKRKRVSRLGVFGELGGKIFEFLPMRGNEFVSGWELEAEKFGQKKSPSRVGRLKKDEPTN